MANGVKVSSDGNEKGRMPMLVKVALLACGTSEKNNNNKTKL